MTIEEKLAYLQKAIEMGADIQVSFHDIREKAEAVKAAEELSTMMNQPFEYKNYKGSDWLKIYNPEAAIDTTFFYEEDYLQEDVNLDGGEEHETA
jgi:hypothetical protein